MKLTQFAALLGFSFAVVWTALDFGDAILCLVCALGFYLACALYQGEVHVSDLQRFSQNPRS